MKKALPIICIITFIVGIAMILSADTGLIASYESAIIAGAITSIFSGIYLGIYFFTLFKPKQ